VQSAGPPTRSLRYSSPRASILCWQIRDADGGDVAAARRRINDVSHATDCAAIVRAVATLGLSHGMATTAEGVENQGEARNVAVRRVHGLATRHALLGMSPLPRRTITNGELHTSLHAAVLRLCPSSLQLSDAGMGLCWLTPSSVARRISCLIAAGGLIPGNRRLAG
jgi:hypothetical protein